MSEPSTLRGPIPTTRKAAADLAHTVDIASCRLYSLLEVLGPHAPAELVEIAEELDNALLMHTVARVARMRGPLGDAFRAQSSPDTQEGRVKPSLGHLRLV
jgi:hypothetical protein